MPVVRRPSGIVVETAGPALIESDDALSPGPAAPVLPPVETRRSRRRGTARVASGATADEVRAIHDAMGANGITLMDSIPLGTTPAPIRTESVRRRRRRAQEPATPGALVSSVSLAVPLEANEHAVVLLEQDGVYNWHVLDGDAAASPVRGAKRRGKRGRARKAATGKRVVHFRVQLAPPARPPSGSRRRRRGGLLGRIIGKATAYVFRFIAKPLLKAAAKFLERDIKEGLVHIKAAETASWELLGPTGTIAPPNNRPARVLLFVHGTFSSTLGSFGALAATADGRAFLEAALAQYDFVLGWDHRTLSVPPDVNAQACLDWFGAQKWNGRPRVDAIAFSRGGLVLRSLVEELLPSSQTKIDVGRAVFVACTNGGTELARPENWHSFADRYTNLAAAGSRVLSLIPGFAGAAQILAEAIRGVGGLLKVLATSAVDDNAIPGLSAMNPSGPFVTTINERQAGQPDPAATHYFAVTSNFDPDTAGDEGTSHVAPGFLLQVADKASDSLHGKPNDLVVHVAAMTAIDPDLGTYVREKLDYGTNGVVHHCHYFAEPNTAVAIQRWLQAP